METWILQVVCLGGWLSCIGAYEPTMVVDDQVQCERMGRRWAIERHERDDTEWGWRCYVSHYEPVKLPPPTE